jgi:hypothetical protein
MVVLICGAGSKNVNEVQLSNKDFTMECCFADSQCVETSKEHIALIGLRPKR